MWGAVSPGEPWWWHSLGCLGLGQGEQVLPWDEAWVGHSLCHQLAAAEYYLWNAPPAMPTIKQVTFTLDMWAHWGKWKPWGQMFKVKATLFFPVQLTSRDSGRRIRQISGSDKMRICGTGWHRFRILFLSRSFAYFAWLKQKSTAENSKLQEHLC